MLVRAVSTSIAMRASLNLIAWNFAIGCPNWMRSFAYLTAASSAACETPTERASWVIRPPSSVPVTCMKPPSTPPRSAAAGTFMSSKASAAVSEVWWPVFFSFRDTENPGVFVSTMNIEMPSPRRDGSVYAATRQ